MNDRIDDLIALAALGELTAPESAELEAAVAADARVADELADALASAAALQASPIEAPPATLKASVLNAVAGIAQEPAAIVHPDEIGHPDDGNSWLEHPDDGTSWVTHAQPVPARRRSRLAPLLAAAAILALVAGGVLIASNGGDQDDPIAAVVDADDAVAHSVSGPIGDLQLVYSADEDAFVLVGDSVQAAPDDSTYQVWLVSGEADPASLGTFEPDADGAMEMRADGVDPTGSTIAITVEPVGGSDQPTSPVVAQSA